MPIDESRIFKPVRIALVTVSDTRTLADDTSGDILAGRIEEAGHELAEREIIRDDADALVELLQGWIDDDTVDCVISTGGTGLTGRDVTPEALDRGTHDPLAVAVLLQIGGQTEHRIGPGQLVDQLGAVHRDDLRAFGQQPLGDPPADALGGTGDHGNLVVETCVHQPSLDARSDAQAPVGASLLAKFFGAVIQAPVPIPFSRASLRLPVRAVHALMRWRRTSRSRNWPARCPARG